MPLCDNCFNPLIFAEGNDIIQDVMNQIPGLQDESIAFRNKSCESIQLNVLSVGQREYAVVDPTSRGDLQEIATVDATTCHIAVLIHNDSRTVGVAHFDSSHTQQGVKDMLQLFQRRVGLTFKCPASPLRVDLYLVGGFIDSKGASEVLSRELLGVFHAVELQTRLRVACISKVNTILKHGRNHPAVCGVGVHLDDLNIHPVKCLLPGPDASLKTCRIFCGSKEDGSSKMFNTYNNDTLQVEVGPFTYNPMDHIDQWLALPDQLLLQYTSTSPEQESPAYCEQTRTALRLMQQHPRPAQSLFSSGHPRCHRSHHGEWQLVE